MGAKDMRLFAHMLYEYKKGVRRLAMYTCSDSECLYCTDKLMRCGISYLCIPASDNRVNLFFGDCLCIQILESFDKIKLNELDEKEDFILGALLGYDISKQCERYLSKVYPVSSIEQMVSA